MKGRERKQSKAIQSKTKQSKGRERKGKEVIGKGEKAKQREGLLTASPSNFVSDRNGCTSNAIICSRTATQEFLKCYEYFVQFFDA